MEQYRNLDADSVIEGFELAPGAVTIYYRDRWKYLYTDQSIGRQFLAQMVQLATDGRGLDDFLRLHGKTLYASKGWW